MTKIRDAFLNTFKIVGVVIDQSKTVVESRINGIVVSEFIGKVKIADARRKRANQKQRGAVDSGAPAFDRFAIDRYIADK